MSFKHGFGIFSAKTSVKVMLGAYTHKVDNFIVSPFDERYITRQLHYWSDDLRQKDLGNVGKTREYGTELERVSM